MAKSSPSSCSLVLMCTVFSCLIAMAMSGCPAQPAPPALDICPKIPIENIEPCKPFLTEQATTPTKECCNGARTWLGAPPDVVCNCYRASPNRLTFKPSKLAVGRLESSCRLGFQFFKYAVCLICTE